MLAERCGKVKVVDGQRPVRNQGTWAIIGIGIVDEETVPGCMLEAGDARVLGLCCACQTRVSQHKHR